MCNRKVHKSQDPVQGTFDINVFLFLARRACLTSCAAAAGVKLGSDALSTNQLAAFSLLKCISCKVLVAALSAGNIELGLLTFAASLKIKKY